MVKHELGEPTRFRHRKIPVECATHRFVRKPMPDEPLLPIRAGNSFRRRDSVNPGVVQYIFISIGHGAPPVRTSAKRGIRRKTIALRYVKPVTVPPDPCFGALDAG